MSLNASINNCVIIAASGGIGLEMTRLLLEHDKRVFATTRSLDSANAAHLQELLQYYPSQLTLLELDVTDQQSVAACFTAIAESAERLHLVMNCSGLLHDENTRPEKRLEDLESNQLLKNFQVNSIGPMLIARYAFPLFKHDEPNVLANMSARVGSISDNRIGGWYGYRTSKAAQNMATRTLSIELKRRSPTTICVGLHPGTVNTGLSKPFQRAVKAGQLKTPAQAAKNLYSVIDKLSAQDSGKVFAWDGSEILP